MICSYKDCTMKGIDQPTDQFISTNGKYATRSCLTCRIRGQGYNKRSRAGQADIRHSGQASQAALRQSRVMKPGDPPQFLFAWQEKMYREWLRGLCASVERIDSLTPEKNDDIVLVSSGPR